MAKQPTGAPRGAPRSTSLLKLIHGTATPKRMRLEPALGGHPEPPPDANLNERERAIFNWYCANCTVLGLAAVDGALLSQLARVTVLCAAAEAKVAEFGAIMRGSPEQGPREQPYSQLARRLRAEIRHIQCTLAIPPGWRLKLAEPVGRTVDSDGWANLD